MNANENEEKVTQEQMPEIKDNTSESLSSQGATTSKESTSVEIALKKKLKKQKLAIIGIVSIVLVAVIVVLIIKFVPSKFDKVKDTCFDMVGRATAGKDYLILDTDPYEDLDELNRILLLPTHQANTLEAIQYANIELGFTDTLYTAMMETTSLMGLQTEENDKYKVSWTYHPDHGLEVTYKKK